MESASGCMNVALCLSEIMTRQCGVEFSGWQKCETKTCETMQGRKNTMVVYRMKIVSLNDFILQE